MPREGRPGIPGCPLPLRGVFVSHPCDTNYHHKLTLFRSKSDWDLFPFMNLFIDFRMNFFPRRNELWLNLTSDNVFHVFIYFYFLLKIHD